MSTGDCVLVWHDDHGDFIFSGDDAALKILQKRLDSQYLNYPDDAENRARVILDQRDETAALSFLKERTYFEYERISQQRIN